MRTFHSQYRQLRSGHLHGARTSSGGFRWRAAAVRYVYDPNGLQKMIGERTPRNDTLRETARKRVPPPEWFEADDDPTQPED